jgi:hypothetical protein
MEPTATGPSRCLHPLDQLAQITIAGLWLSALVEAAVWVLNGISLPWTVGLAVPSWPVLVFGLIAAIVELASLAVLIVWLYFARSNVDVLPGSQPDWSLGWTIGSWFTPILNLVLPAIVIADVARNSTDEIAGRETTRQVGRVYGWWALQFAQALGGLAWQAFLTPIVIAGVDRYLHFDHRLAFALASPFLGVVLALAGAYVGSQVVGGITREQRARLERVWAGNAGEAYAAGIIG